MGRGAAGDAVSSTCALDCPLLRSGRMRSHLWLSIGVAAALGACSQSLSGNLTGTGGTGGIVDTTTGQEYSVDPEIKNGGGGLGDGC